MKKIKMIALCLFALQIGLGNFFQPVKAQTISPNSTPSQEKTQSISSVSAKSNASVPKQKQLKGKQQKKEPTQAKKKDQSLPKEDPPLTLPSGYESASINDKVGRTENGNKLELAFSNKPNAPCLPISLYNGKSFLSYVYGGPTKYLMDIYPIVNDQVTYGKPTTDYGGEGIFARLPASGQIIGKNENSLYQAFYFNDNQKNHFKIEITQTFQVDNAILTTYILQNLSETSLKMGLMHQAVLMRRMLIPLPDLRGAAAPPAKDTPSLALLPTGFENWSFTEDTSQFDSYGTGFRGYTPRDITGKGWETGYQNGNPAKPLSEGVALPNDSFRPMRHFNAKSLGKEVAPGGKISFTLLTRYGQNQPPGIEVAQSDFTISQGEDLTLPGQAWDPDTSNFQVAVVDKNTNETITKKEWNEVPLAEKQDFHLRVPAEKLPLGKHDFLLRVTDQYGETKELPVTVTVSEQLQFKNVPEALLFKDQEVIGKTTLIKRQDANWKMDIDNSIGKKWRIKAQATPVQDSKNKTYRNALVLKKSAGELLDLASGQQIIATGDESNKFPTVSWTEDKGVLFQYNPGTMKADTYTPTLSWTLEETPA